MLLWRQHPPKAHLTTRSMMLLTTILLWTLATHTQATSSIEELAFQRMQFWERHHGDGWETVQGRQLQETECTPESLANGDCGFGELCGVVPEGAASIACGGNPEGEWSYQLGFFEWCWKTFDDEEGFAAIGANIFEREVAYCSIEEVLFTFNKEVMVKVFLNETITRPYETNMQVEYALETCPAEEASFFGAYCATGCPTYATLAFTECISSNSSQCTICPGNRDGNVDCSNVDPVFTDTCPEDPEADDDWYMDLFDYMRESTSTSTGEEVGHDGSSGGDGNQNGSSGGDGNENGSSGAASDENQDGSSAGDDGSSGTDGNQLEDGTSSGECTPESLANGDCGFSELCGAVPEGAASIACGGNPEGEWTYQLGFFEWCWKTFDDEEGFSAFGANLDEREVAYCSTKEVLFTFNKGVMAKVFFNETITHPYETNRQTEYAVETCPAEEASFFGAYCATGCPTYAALAFTECVSSSSSECTICPGNRDGNVDCSNVDPVFTGTCPEDPEADDNWVTELFDNMGGNSSIGEEAGHDGSSSGDGNQGVSSGGNDGTGGSSNNSQNNGGVGDNSTGGEGGNENSTDPPSDVPSDIPSSIPSETLTAAPSDVVSSTPTVVPSSAPTVNVTNAPVDSQSSAPDLCHSFSCIALPTAATAVLFVLMG